MLRDRRSTCRRDIGSWMMNLDIGGFSSDWFRDYELRTLFVGAT